MSNTSRRDILKAGVAAGALAGISTLSFAAEPGAKATDWVTLGKSNVQVTRLAFGTGTMNGRVQRDLGQEGFTRLVRYAYDQGIRFFETAQSYPEMHTMLGIALKGLPRESYRLMTKLTTDDADPMQTIDSLRRQIQSDYFDIMLLHVQQSPTWPTDSLRWQEGINEAQQRKIVIARGASVHGLPALHQVPTTDWLQVAMIRMNHKGTIMDNEPGHAHEPGNVPEVVKYVHMTRQAGMGVISMKLIGEGRFTEREDRQKSMRFAFNHAGVNCVTVGYKSPAEIDEAISNVNLALA